MRRMISSALVGALLPAAGVTCPAIAREGARASRDPSDSLATLVVLVRSAYQHDRLPYASIVLVSQKRGGLTTEDGIATLPNLRPGRAVVVVSYLGYRSVRDSLVLHAGARDTLGVSMPEPIQRDWDYAYPEKLPIFVTEPLHVRL